MLHEVWNVIHYVSLTTNNEKENAVEKVIQYSFWQCWSASVKVHLKLQMLTVNYNSYLCHVKNLSDFHCKLQLLAPTPKLFHDAFKKQGIMQLSHCYTMLLLCPINL